VVSAYFEALEETELPFRFTDLELTKAEQVAMAGGDSQLGMDTANLVAALLSVEPGFLEPQFPHESHLTWLRGYYPMVSHTVTSFVRGLAVWDQLTETHRIRFLEAMASIPKRACGKYEDLFRRLVAEFPEVACWANLRDHQATRTEVRNLGIALAGLERRLTEISTGSVPDERRASLARAYQAELEQPVVESGDVPAGLRIPALGQVYVTPRFRARPVIGEARPSEESWWEDVHIREDLEDFLIGYLTSPQATRAPLLVLGQPGSGKSVLTRVLAARLPAADFLPVRVVLREVPTMADLQDQIEHAIRNATGERLDWPALARLAGDALPVVMLDGFDELLQATGVSQTDYLGKIAKFQYREKQQGRPVAVVVTSRTSVADRARTHEDMVALRLEPFDPARVTAWLQTWNAANVGHFAACGLAPLAPEVVLAHRELAEQPLLLLMLALYDADGNALQRVASDLPRSELYQRLLHSFARREVVKNRPGLPEQELDRAVEDELRRLSVVAFAMFNRGSQWIAESDLDADLLALLGPPATAAAGPDLRAPLRAAQIVLGRFFFVHRAQASRDDTRLETYEFLHATFGEFLVARLTWQVLLDIAAREAASTMWQGATPVDDDRLHALLSFTSLSVRAPVIGFLNEMAADLDQPKREALTRLLVRLFRVVHQPRPTRGYTSYEPRPSPVPARHAAYGANLVLLAVCAVGSIRASELYEMQSDVVNSWHSEALLWRSQLNAEEWTSLVEALVLERLWDGEHRDIRLTLDNGTFQTSAVDLNWTYKWAYNLPPDNVVFRLTSHHPDILRRKAYFQCGMVDDVAWHTLEPLASTLGSTVNTFSIKEKKGRSSVAHALLDMWLLPLRDPTAEERQTAYRRCADIARHNLWSEDRATGLGYTTLLLDRLATDEKASPALAADVLSTLTAVPTPHGAIQGGGATLLHKELVPCLARCALAFLGRDRESDHRIAELLSTILTHHAPVDVLELQVFVRLLELDLSTPLPFLETWIAEFDHLLQQIASRRPDLMERLRQVIEERGITGQGAWS